MHYGAPSPGVCLCCGIRPVWQRHGRARLGRGAQVGCRRCRDARRTLESVGPDAGAERRRARGRRPGHLLSRRRMAGRGASRGPRRRGDGAEGPGVGRGGGEYRLDARRRRRLDGLPSEPRPPGHRHRPGRGQVLGLRQGRLAPPRHQSREDSRRRRRRRRLFARWGLAGRGGRRRQHRHLGLGPG